MTRRRGLSVAFYAPLKAPDHEIPSGDRQMARMLIAALQHAGHDVAVASSFRSYCASPSPSRWKALRSEADRCRGDLEASWRRTAPPDLWFTYHNHYKAPDLLGPDLTKAYGLPYVMAEASHSARRAIDWGVWASLADTATAAADLHLCFTARDRTGLADVLSPHASVVDLPPFLDEATWPAPSARSDREGPPVLLAVAMMRHGDKLQSYRFLAEALEHLSDAAWRLRIVGDGPARDEVLAAFRLIPADRFHLCGRLDPEGIAAEMRRADILAWPGFGEAYGLSYLEAQSQGLPVVALDTAGVASVVRHGATGFLERNIEPRAYAAALRRLVDDRPTRSRLGEKACAWVHQERGLGGAAQTIEAALRLVMHRIGQTRAG